MTSQFLQAYRRAALALHPDKCQLEGAKEAFQKVRPHRADGASQIVAAECLAGGC